MLKVTQQIPAPIFFNFVLENERKKIHKKTFMDLIVNIPKKPKMIPVFSSNV